MRWARAAQRVAARPLRRSSFGDSATAPRAAAAGAANPAGGIDALLALQAIEDPMLRKKKLVQHQGGRCSTPSMQSTDLLAGEMGEGHLNQIMALIGRARKIGRARAR